MRLRFCTSRVSALLIVFALASVSSAGSVNIVQTPNPGTEDLAGTVTNDILLDSTGTTILSQQLRLVLTAGSVFDHAFGSNGPPNAALIGTFPELAFDSFLSTGGVDNTSPTPTIVGRSDRFDGPGGTPAMFSATEWDVLWGPALGQDTADQTDYLSARLTLSDDSMGTFAYRVGFGDGTEWIETGIPVVNGVIGEPIIVDDPVLSVLFAGASVGATVDLGTVLENEELVAQFTIANTGAAGSVLNITSFDVTDDFSLVGDFPNNIPEGTPASFQVRANDTSVLGSLMGRVEIASNGGEVSFDLTARVIPEPSSLALLGLAMVGIVGFAGRRRS